MDWPLFSARKGFVPAKFDFRGGGWPAGCVRLTCSFPRNDYARWGWEIGVFAEVGGGGKWFGGMGIGIIFEVCDWGLVGWVFYVALIGLGMAFVGL
jgi:hypothetical protein